VDADLDTLATALYVRTDDLLKCCPERALWRPVIGIARRSPTPNGSPSTPVMRMLAPGTSLEVRDERDRAAGAHVDGRRAVQPRRGRKARQRRPGRPAGSTVGSPVSTIVVVSRAPDGQQDQQHRPRHRGQSLVARGSAGAVSRRGWPGCPRCLDLLEWPRWLLVRAPRIRPAPPVPVFGHGMLLALVRIVRVNRGACCTWPRWVWLRCRRGRRVVRLLSSGAVASGRLRSPGDPPARRSRR
jgi:hypothetical protein